MNEAGWLRHGCVKADSIEKAIKAFNGYIPFDTVVIYVSDIQEIEEFYSTINKNLMMMGNRVIFLYDNITISNSIINNRLATLIPITELQELLKEKDVSCYPALLRYLWLKNIKRIDEKRIELIISLDVEREHPLCDKWNKITQLADNYFGAIKSKIINKDYSDIKSLRDGLVCFDRHNKIKSKSYKRYPLTEIIGNKVFLDLYYEAWDINSPLYLTLFNPPTIDYISLEIYLNLIETGLFNIIIIDERISEQSCNELDQSGDTRLLYHWLAAMQIYCISHINDHSISPNLKNRTISLKIDNDVLILTHEISEEENLLEINENDFLIIHQGILENQLLLNQLATGLNLIDWEQKEGKALFQAIISKLKEHCKYVIIDSGRGIPPTMPDNAKYLPFAALQNSLLRKKPSKYNLIRNLMKLTGRRRELWAE